jgi:hypothetical protein
VLNTTATGGTGTAGYLARAGSNFAYFYVRGDGTAYIDNATANPLGLATNGLERMRIDSAGNVGVNCTPSPWASSWRAIDITTGGGALFGSLAISGITNNAYLDNGVDWRYKSSFGAAQIYMNSSGVTTFYNAAAGTAGNVISFVESMTITAAGSVGIGTSSVNSKLLVTYANPVTVPAAGAGGHCTAFGTVGYGLATGALTNGNAYLQATRWDALATNYELLLQPNGGSVGIGTSSPATKLEVSTNTGTETFKITQTDATGGTTARMRLSHGSGTQAVFEVGSGYGALGLTTSGPLAFNTNNTERMRISGAGDVGIGTSTPQAKVEVNGDLDGVYNANVLVTSTANTAKLAFNPTGVSSSGVGNVGGGLVFYASGANTERARIDSSGNLLVGTTSSDGYRFKTEGSYPFLSKATGGSALTAMSVWNNDTAGDNIFIVFSTETGGTTRGSITYNRAGGLVAYNTTSDYRAKDIIGPVENSGTTIDALKVHTGKMRDATIERPMLVAHEAQEVVPYAVTGEKDAVKEDGTPDYQQVDHQVLIPLLIAEIQSLRARVAQLEERK